mmetsp:Transcript_20714/g.53085  ORF Transcript_20714/g.53085 Transcript_20714/m.53085 type:complete len:274 (-) Transcript_20714:424-1245(-)
MVQQHQLRPPRAPTPHQHIGGMRVAVHVAVDKDHLRKGLRHHLRHLAELEPHGLNRQYVGHRAALHEVHRQHTVAQARRVHLWDGDVLADHGARGRKVLRAAAGVGGLVLKVEFHGEVLLDLVHQPLVVEIGAEPAHTVHQRLDRQSVYRRHLPQPGVLHLHRQLAPVLVMRHVHLRERCACDRGFLDGYKHLLWIHPEVLLHDAPHLAPGAHGALVQQVVPHLGHVLPRQEVVQLPDVLAEFDVDAAIAEAQVEQALSPALVAEVQLLLVLG